MKLKREIIKFFLKFNGVRVIFYIFIYIYYAFVCYGIAIVTRRVNFSKIQIMVLFVLLIIINSTIASFRPIYETADTSIYYNAWNGISIGKLKNSKNAMLFANREFYHMEISFLFIMAYLKEVMSFRFFLWIISFIISCLNCYSFALLAAYGLNIYEDKNKFNYFIRHELIHIWTIYLLFVGILYTSVAIRSGLSIALCCYGISLALTHKRVVIPFFIISIGILIHTSGIIFIPIWFLLRFGKKSLSKISIYIFWITLTVIYFFNVSKLVIKGLVAVFNAIKGLLGIAAFSSYLGNIKFQLQLREWYVIFFIGLYLVLTYKRIPNLSKLAKVTIIGLVLATFGAPIHAMSRVTDLFTIFSIPIICSSVGNRNWKTSISYLGMLFILLPQFVLCFARID